MLIVAGGAAEAETSSWEPGTQITARRALRTYSAGNAAQCRDACLGDARCRAWSFQAPTGRRARNRCDLYARIDGKRAVRGRLAARLVAGVKTMPAPPAEPAAQPERAKAAALAPLAEAVVKRGATALPAARELARARQRAIERRAAIVAAGVTESASALPTAAVLARIKREVAALRTATPANAIETGSAALQKPAPPARAQRETAWRTASPLAGVRQGATALRETQMTAAVKETPATRPAPPRRRSSWEPGLFLYGMGFAHDGDHVSAEAGYEIPSAERCRDLCVAHAECTGWKYNAADYPNAEVRRICYLFKGPPIRLGSDKPGVVSGIIGDVLPAAPATPRTAPDAAER